MVEEKEREECEEIKTDRYGGGREGGERERGRGGRKRERTLERMERKKE